MEIRGPNIVLPRKTPDKQGIYNISSYMGINHMPRGTGGQKLDTEMMSPREGGSRQAMLHDVYGRN